MVLFTIFAFAIAATPAAPAELDPLVLARIRDAALKSDWAYARLAELTDTIGPRFSGSPQASAAVEHVANTMKAAGFAVTLQPVTVPHWVRGEEKGELIEYHGRPKGLSQRLSLTALGHSSPTPAEGLVGTIVIVRSVAEVEARAAEVKGNIVLIDTPFDEALAVAGEQSQAYTQAGAARFYGPRAATAAGAIAALVRSVGGANYRLPHTGYTSAAPDGGVVVPSAAVSAEDAMLINRLSAQGPVTMRLTLTPQRLPPAQTANVLADYKGREKPDEIVIVSGHLDSWDLGTGALDDGAGVAASLGAVQLLKSLGLKPRRTIRAVAWMNEENGSNGEDAYVAAAAIDKHVALIEADSGAGRPLGVLANTTADGLKRLQPVMNAFKPLGATVLKHVEGAIGADISELQDKHGVPGFEPYLDGRAYFDYHHTAADTLDKVDPEYLRRQVAVLAVLAYALAEMPDPLPRLPVVRSP